MTLLPLVKVNSTGQSQPTVDLTRRVGPPTHRVSSLTSQPCSLLLIEYGINLTSFLSILELRLSASDSPSCMNNSTSCSWAKKIALDSPSCMNNSLSPSITESDLQLTDSTLLLTGPHSSSLKRGKIGDSRLDSPSRSSDSPSHIHAATLNSILLESSV